MDGRRARRRSRHAAWRLATAAVAVAVLGTACSTSGRPEGEPSGRDRPSSTGSGSEAGRLRDARVGLRRIAVLEQPTGLAVRRGDPSLYVTEKAGRVVALREGRPPEVVLDLRGRVSLGSEQGLLGLAFSPDGRFLYVDLTDRNGDTRLLEFRVEDGTVVAGSERRVLFVDQPYSNHNGGAIAFGPDGSLYVTLGDGGGAGDPEDRAQDRSTLLGKILRISPRPRDGRPYGIPRDNPFVGRAGVRPEIWAYGLRNPRLTFDRRTGDLWIGDVGQSAWEEIDVLPAHEGGANLGWDLLEGSHPYEGRVGDRETVPPVYEYPHEGAVCAVIGGYVYRGTAIRALRGAYVFSDYCDGRLRAFVLRDGVARAHRFLGPKVSGPSAFGEDADGELYVLSLSGPVYRLVPRR